MPDFDDGFQRVAVELFDDEQLGLGRYRCFLGFVAELADVGGGCRAEHVEPLFACKRS